MKKKLITVKDFADKMDAIKRRIKNAFSEEGAEAAAALRDLIDELEAAEIEIDEREFAARVSEVIKAYNGNADEEVPASVANALAAKFAELQKRMPVSNMLTPAIKNQVAAAILKAHNKNEVKNAVADVLVKNGISGLSFEETVDFAINENWGDSNRLFSALRKVPFTKFFYSEQDALDSGIVAHGWDKSSESAKEIQAIIVNGKTISTQYIYKRQQVAQEDLDDIRENGGESTFLSWLNDELDRQIVNTVVALILGHTAEITDITSIETLYGLGVTDSFRTAVTVANLSALTIKDIRALSDAIPNPAGKAKWLVIDQTTLTAISEFVYASGGDTIYHTIDEMKGYLGVDEIYVTSLATVPTVFLPDGYWIKEKNTISVSYPTWEHNVQNWQKERNMGGGVHDLKSVAFPVGE